MLPNSFKVTNSNLLFSVVVHLDNCPCRLATVALTSTNSNSSGFTTVIPHPFSDSITFIFEVDLVNRHMTTDFDQVAS